MSLLCFFFPMVDIIKTTYIVLYNKKCLFRSLYLFSSFNFVFQFRTQDHYFLCGLRLNSSYLSVIWAPIYHCQWCIICVLLTLFFLLLWWKVRVSVTAVAERSRSLHNAWLSQVAVRCWFNVLFWTDSFALGFGYSQALLFQIEPSYPLTIVNLCPYILFHFPQRTWYYLQVKFWFVLIFPSCGGWELECCLLYILLFLNKWSL